MAFTAGNVALPASGGTPVLVYQTPDSVPTNVVINSTPGTAWILNSATQTPSTGFPISGIAVEITGLIGAIYAVSQNASFELGFAASNIA